MTEGVRPPRRGKTVSAPLRPFFPLSLRLKAFLGGEGAAGLGGHSFWVSYPQPEQHWGSGAMGQPLQSPVKGQAPGSMPPETRSIGLAAALTKHHCYLKAALAITDQLGPCD